MPEPRDRSESALAQGNNGLPISRGDPPELTGMRHNGLKQDSLLNGTLANAYLTHTGTAVVIDKS